MTANNLSLVELRRFAPDSPVLAFRPADSGNPMQDWCNHVSENSRYRRELEEFAVLGDVVVRIADGIEPEAIERVKILSLEYAVRTLKNETDAKEFIRSVRAIAAPDAGQFELEQIAAHYYGEIRRGRAVNEVLKEMAMLGIEMEAIVATVNEREIECSESDAEPEKLTLRDEKRISAAQQNLPPLPAPTPNFDAEIAAINQRLSSSSVTRWTRDEFAEYYLGDTGKSLAELDADYAAFEQLEQYDENGIVGFAMSGGQHVVVVYDFQSEVDETYLPPDAHDLAKEMRLIFVGHRVGGAKAQKARQFIFTSRVERNEIAAAKKGLAQLSTAIPSLEKFSPLPFSDAEFEEWLAAKLDALHPRRVQRNVRRITHNKNGKLFEFVTTQEVNPEWEEMQYTAAVCRILWSQMQTDFHLRSLRRAAYQNCFLDIRKTTDTAELAKLKKEMFDLFKEQKKLSLKEFTALNTAAKSQEARLADKLAPAARKTLWEINRASANRLRFFKYFLYNDSQIQALTRQEKQRLWDAVRCRETTLQTVKNTGGGQDAKATASQQHLQRTQTQKQLVRVAPRTV